MFVLSDAILVGSIALHIKFKPYISSGHTVRFTNTAASSLFSHVRSTTCMQIAAF